MSFLIPVRHQEKKTDVVQRSIRIEYHHRVLKEVEDFVKNNPGFTSSEIFRLVGAIQEREDVDYFLGNLNGKKIRLINGKWFHMSSLKTVKDFVKNNPGISTGKVLATVTATRDDEDLQYFLLNMNDKKFRRIKNKWFHVPSCGDTVIVDGKEFSLLD